MANLLTKTFEMLWSRQGDQIVCDYDKSPVCLNALPGTHKHLSEGQVLLDVLVKDFDSESLAVKSDHLGFARLEIVGNQESGFLGASFGDKQKDGSDLGQVDDSLGNLEFSFLGNTHGFVSPRSLGQVTNDGLLAAYFQNTIAFDCGHKRPAGFGDRNKNGSAGIPAVRQYGHGGMNLVTKNLKDFLSQLNFAFEFALQACCFGTITMGSPSQPLAGDLENASHHTLAFDQPIGRMVNAQAFDMLAFSGTGGIVDSGHELRHLVGFLSQKILVGSLKMLALLGRTIEKALQVVGNRFRYLAGNFPSGMKLDEPDQSDQVNQEMFDLRFRQNAQEISQSGRNFLREKFSHGFCVLLALAGIGDFDQKPFYLKGLLSFIT